MYPLGETNSLLGWKTTRISQGNTLNTFVSGPIFQAAVLDYWSVEYTIFG